MEERRERLIDLSVAAAALIIGSFMAWQAVVRSRDGDGSARGDVRLIEQAGIATDAGMALPLETRQSIGLEGQPEGTFAGVLGVLERQIATRPAATELRLVWVALAAGWREDALARAAIAELASDPANLTKHRKTLDDLLRLANGKGADDLAQLEATFVGLGASRWLTGHVRERHLANLQDPAAPALAAELSRLALDCMTRWTVIEGIEAILMPTLGLAVLVLFPLFLRARLARRGVAVGLGPSPFRVERSWRVFFGWFVGFQVLGNLIVVLVSIFVSGAQAIAFAMLLQALASIGVSLWIIDLWGRLPRDTRPAPVALGLAGPGRVKAVLLWLLPGIALAMALVRAASDLNLLLLGRPPDTQSAVQLITDSASPLLMALIGVGAVLLAPLAEEIVFRGFLFRNLRDSLGKGLALPLSGLAFAAVHFEPTLILPLTALGVALALLYEWSGSLFVPISVHALWNLFALIKIELWRI